MILNFLLIRFKYVLEKWALYNVNINNVLLPIVVSITKLIFGKNYDNNITNTSIIDMVSSFIYFVFVLPFFIFINLIILSFAIIYVFVIPLLISFTYGFICFMLAIICFLTWLLITRIKNINLNTIKQTQQLPIWLAKLLFEYSYLNNLSAIIFAAKQLLLWESFIYDLILVYM